MYDELVKRLRASCESCKLWDGYKCCLKGECSAQKSLQAADAIEDLEKAINIILTEYTKANNKRLIAEAKARESEVDNINLTGWLAEEHAKHLWIPVTEQLPKENGFYLCLYKHKASGGVAMDEGLSILQWINNKWGINDIYLVTHWMPLPQPPEDK